MLLPLHAILSAAALLQASAPQTPAVTPIDSPVDQWANLRTVSPDGRFIIVDRDTGLYAFDRTTKRSHFVMRGDDAGWSPNGRFLAFRRSLPDGTGPFLYVAPVDSATGRLSGPERRVTTVAVGSYLWTPDSRRLAFTHRVTSDSTRVYIIPFNGGEPRMLTQQVGAIDCRGSSPDASILYCTFARFVGRLAVATGKVDSMRPIGPPLAAVSPDGRYLVQHARGQRLIISTAADGKIVSASAVSDVEQFTFSRRAPDKLIGFQRIVPMNLHSVSLVDGTVRELTSGDDRRDWSPKLSPDGNMLAFSTLVGGKSRVALANPDASNPRVIPASVQVGHGLQWSPRGRHIVYATVGVSPRELRVVDVSTRTDRTLVPFDSVSGSELRPEYAWRPDGAGVRYLYFRRESRSAPVKREIREAMLDGRDMLVASIPDSIGTVRFISPTTAIATISLPEDRAHGRLDVLTLGENRWRTVYTGPIRSRPHHPGISADGKWIAFSETDAKGQNVRLLNLETGASRVIANTMGGELNAAQFLPDGKNLLVSICATCMAGTEHWDWVLMPLNGDPMRGLTTRDPKWADGSFEYSITPDFRTMIYDAETVWRSRLVEVTVPGLKR